MGNTPSDEMAFKQNLFAETLMFLRNFTPLLGCLQLLPIVMKIFEAKINQLSLDYHTIQYNDSG